MFSEKRAITLACAASAALLLSTWARAQNQVFVDNFSNGSVANSDTQTGFWNTVLDETGTTAETVGGPVNITAKGASAADPYPFTEIGTSALQHSFNFFQQPIILSVSGLSYSASTTVNALTEFNFGNQVISQTGVQTEYNEPSDFSLEICPPGGPNGQLIMGEKQNYPNHSSPWDSYQFLGPIGHVATGAQNFNGGQIRGFDLVIASSFFYLKVYSDASATDTSTADQVTTIYSGGMGLNWTPDPASSAGDPALNIETQINEGAGPQVPTDVSSLNIQQLSVSQMPMTFTNGGGDDNWFTAANWSGLSSKIDAASAAALKITVPDYGSANVILPQASSPTTLSIANGNGDTITLGVLNINSTQPYTIAGSLVQLAAGGGTDVVNITAGNHIINAGVNIFDANTTINMASGSSLTINGPVAAPNTGMNIDTTGGGGALTITGDISAAGPITLSSGTGGITVNGGTTNDFLFHGALTLNAVAGGTVTVNSYIDDPFTTSGNPTTGTYPVSKTGAGTANVSSLYGIPSVTVSAGTLRINASSTANNFLQGASLIDSLTISGAGSKFDLTNNALVIDYNGSSPLATIRGYLRSGALYSSTASLPLGTTVAYAEASEIQSYPEFTQNNGTFYGLQVTGTSGALCIMYTYDGDVNMDGIVDGTDYSLMQGGNGSDWFHGDLNYDGVKNADDWALFQLGVSASSRGNINNLPAPEPGELAMAALGAVGLISRRRRA